MLWLVSLKDKLLIQILQEQKSDAKAIFTAYCKRARVLAIKRRYAGVLTSADHLVNVNLSNCLILVDFI